MSTTKEGIADLMMGKRPQTANLSQQIPLNPIALAVFTSITLAAVV